ncbi:MAG: acetyl-CoA carboxylase biotin carboxylase subunit [Cyclobacteriaceae bacterium]|nr:acetyl-CoA carboxylase biotin carboxylase subunit [Cyclobacteriaceae bacterium]
MAKIKKLLVANRGEIAIRVLRTAKEMGIKTVAVYSEADRNAPHVIMADEAVLLGPPPSSESYLLGDKIIKICTQLNVDAIHPGYGFLSENADFADKVEKAGLIFIGPSSDAIKVMGNKLAAKKAVGSYNIPMVPGTDEAITDPEYAKKLGKEIGYPILIKASAGGGGKGMRVVRNENELEENMNLAISEATSSFGDGSVFIEKFIESNKHIEVQILGDTHGTILYVFERECSIQRRHQKVIEEAPSMVISAELRKQIGEAAVRVAQSCNYYGAGTVEFIYENGAFYFLEMNTRLQVEHPVSELITGIDLVEQQILIAEGKELAFKQEDIKLNGHAFEVRVYAEDPENNFLPDIGTLTTYVRPQGYGVRVDDGFEQGMSVPIYYDPMIAKLITYGATRDEARKRMIRAIDEYNITGIKTTLPFCKYVFEHEAFIDGSFDTKFVEKYFDSNSLANNNLEEEKIAAAMAGMFFNKGSQQNKAIAKVDSKKSNWKQRAFK